MKRKNTGRKLLSHCVVTGDKEIIIDKIKALMASVPADDIINQQLIPALTK